MFEYVRRVNHVREKQPLGRCAGARPRHAKIITVPQGEGSKSFKILETVLRQMLEFNIGRGV